MFRPPPRLRRWVFLLPLLLPFLPVARADTTSPRWPCRADQILVQPESHVAPEAWSRLHAREGSQVLRSFPALGNLQVVSVPAGRTVPELIQRYEASGLACLAEPDYLVHANATPNDPRFLDGTLWGLHNTGQNSGLADADIDAPEAWDLESSAAEIVVAIVDTGIRQTHEDLAANLWVNPTDGTHGFNALANSHDPTDDQGHGTLVAGVLGAVGNNGKGVVGVAWRVQLMACKVLDSAGSGSDATLIAGLEFARTNGARVINASLDSPAPSLALSNAIQRLHDDGILLVASCGNNSLDVDRNPRYPSCYPIGNILSVAYTDRLDALGSLSNFGQTNVDLAAPAGGMQSTFFSSDNAYLGGSPVTGSSLAAPYLSGALALLLARYPADTPNQTIERVLLNTDPLPSLHGRCVTGGRLNLRRALSPPVRLSLQLIPPGPDLRLRLTGEPGGTWTLEASSDLAQWTPVQTNTLPDTGWVEDESPAAGQAHQFFRAVLTRVR